MIPRSKEPTERADAIKKLEERWLLKSKEKEASPETITPKKSRTSLTNPVVKNNSLTGQSKKDQSALSE